MAILGAMANTIPSQMGVEVVHLDDGAVLVREVASRLASAFPLSSYKASDVVLTSLFSRSGPRSRSEPVRIVFMWVAPARLVKAIVMALSTLIALHAELPTGLFAYLHSATAPTREQMLCAERVFGESG